MAAAENDAINHPSHYTRGTIECIDAIEGLGFGYLEGNVLKYLTRYPFKGGIEDLLKAKWYLNRLIEREEKKLPASEGKEK